MPAVPATAADAQIAAARAAWQRNDVPRAEALLRECQASEPAREDAAMLLAEVLRSQGRLGAAAGVVAAFAHAAPDAGAASRAAGFARECGRHAVAAAICEEAFARGLVSPGLQVLAGHVARESGDFATARQRYLEALDAGADLEHQHVLGALANTRRYADPADPDIARFAAHFADARWGPRSRASAGFALAKARDDLGDTAAAADALRQANALVHALRPWDRAAWQALVSTRRRGQVACASARDASGFAPVFIVGLPRTGTTLTATLLARASGACDRGELRSLRYIAGQLMAGGHLGSASALAEASGLYRRLAVQDDAPAPWYLDQDPLNFRYLDIAAAMFPGARVIHLRRDPRDTALSLWSQDFAHPDLAFAYDFGDIADCMSGHAALMRHWHETLRIPIHELDYETLVADPEAALAELCNFIGAAPRVGADAAATAPVQSASVWQARQPVYSTSVGRWRRYAPYIPELERFGDTD